MTTCKCGGAQRVVESAPLTRNDKNNRTGGQVNPPLLFARRAHADVPSERLWNYDAILQAFIGGNARAPMEVPSRWLRRRCEPAPLATGQNDQPYLPFGEGSGLA